MSVRPYSYGRRRALAVLALAAVIAATAWVVLSAKARHHGSHAATTATTTAGRPTTRTASDGLSLSGIAPGRWVALTPSPTARGDVSAARIGDMTYVVGGLDASGHPSAIVQQLNLRTGRWRDVTPLPQALDDVSAVGYGGQLYVVGGDTSPGDASTGAVATFWRYDPGSGRWSRMPPAPVARAAAGAAVLNHRLYVAGGRNDTASALSSVDVFDFAAGQWISGPPLAVAREHLAVVATHASIWALGGDAGGQTALTAVERYEPGGAAWQSMSPLPVARSDLRAAMAAEGVVVVGGEDGTQLVGEVDRLDLGTGHWSQLPALPTPRHGLGLVADGPLLFAIDGGSAAGLTTSRVVSRLRAG